MNDHDDDRLDKLFRTARRVMTDVTDLERGFEDRFRERLVQYKQKDPPLFVWSWRLAPVMTVVLFFLMVLNAVTAPPPRSVDILHLMSNGYEQGQMIKFLLEE